MAPAGLQVAQRRDVSLINWRKILEEVWLAFDYSKEEDNNKTKYYDAEPPHENLLSSVHQRRVHPRAQGGRGPHLHGRQGALDRQRYDRTALAIPEIRVHLPARLRDRQRGAARLATHNLHHDHLPKNPSRRFCTQFET
jgi:uncharacterized protein YjhX (UPF0386 family)